MSYRSALTDDQVNNELKKMEAFINKEAEEKAKEIQLKADEEYEIEKASIVRSEIQSIDTLYQQKFKKSSLNQQITKSTIANKTRLKILSTKEKVLDDVFEGAELELKKISTVEKDYLPILVGLIEESILILLEKTVTLKIREKDLEITKKAIVEAAENFESKTKFAVDIKINEEDFLSSDIAGGIIAVNSTGKIEVNNTLEERLKLLSEEALPGIRLELFGPSLTRKFFD